MELKLLDNTGSITVAESAFNAEYNEALVHQVVVANLAYLRSGSHKQKTRGEVHGSNKKPWNQKKTGNARAGDRKGPLWRSGGVTFAARPQDYSQKVNKKMFRNALRSVLSELLRQDRLVIVKDFELENHKTKGLVARLKELNLENVLIVDCAVNSNVQLAQRNLHKVNYLTTANVNPLNLISNDKVLLTEAAVKEFEERLK